MNQLETYFEPFRNGIIGNKHSFRSPYGEKRIVYADWTASGRLYAPIEKKISETFGTYVGNTHSESSITGSTMTEAYQHAHEIIKSHVNAGPDDVILTPGFGMTAAVCKFQRVLGLRVPEQLSSYVSLPEHLRPVVFITHMEHHSNQTTWLETIAEVVCIEPNAYGLVDLNSLQQLLMQYKDRQLKIGAFTACSNVTGVQPDYHRMARIMHENGGLCFVDFAACAPYVNVNMHPKDPLEKLDAIYFSPHKFLGGPGSSGVLIFDSNLYKNKIPDHPGGGTVDWTNPWGEHKFVSNIEVREDGGTPGFLQAIKSALCIQLKNKMSAEKMAQRENEMVQILFKELRAIPQVHILADSIEQRLGIFSFFTESIHYNLLTKLLNDRFGVQVRGGCSCAGTYGHYLLHVDPNRSRRITEKINQGDFSEKPGWVRLSVHPTMTDEEVDYIANSLRETICHAEEWAKDYSYSSSTNEFINIHPSSAKGTDVRDWFQLN